MYEIATKIEEDWVPIGFCAVDSGTIVIGDPGYLIGMDERKYEEITEDALKDRNRLAGASIASGIAGFVVTMQSGIGDGHYPVEVRYVDDPDWGRRIAEARIRFLQEPGTS